MSYITTPIEISNGSLFIGWLAGMPVALVVLIIVARKMHAVQSGNEVLGCGVALLVACTFWPFIVMLGAGIGLVLPVGWLAKSGTAKTLPDIPNPPPVPRAPRPRPRQRPRVPEPEPEPEPEPTPPPAVELPRRRRRP